VAKSKEIKEILAEIDKNLVEFHELASADDEIVSSMDAVLGSFDHTIRQVKNFIVYFHFGSKMGPRR
jgi:hypothetical protein